MSTRMLGLNIREVGRVYLLNPNTADPMSSGIPMVIRSNQDFSTYRVVGITARPNQSGEFSLLLAGSNALKLGIWKSSKVKDYLPKEVKMLMDVLKIASGAASKSA